ncbi:TetR/AcrR family transcriptional regulator [Streptomyces alkaliterrae]|uniref:TetR family transcriptional regulator n=1 Tax=Streptomyces alkaliterrae TaxID=2213162 RepID=A0A5P0YJN3_9ACTN|nr:TetR/AcrR family transcriptional regulator [Streptomyces alkaliterrae]MBB1258665.1 TetR/AcrR family transcriptional regulator [Streptomyces alkaliterrae]MQS00584.1 TetR family transcriptional regulator [Streptomyces alkaliterrae]
MPTARESLLDAAQAVLVHRPWSTVRMVEVAALAGVSRQTLYNEFSSKEGLGAALVHQRVEVFLRGAAATVATARREGGDPAVCWATGVVWILHRAREEPLVRAAMTGCWSSRLPLPQAPPERLLERLCERMLAALDAAGAVTCWEAPVVRRACEAGLRMALSYVVAPPDEPEAAARVADVVTAMLRHLGDAPADTCPPDAADPPDAANPPENGHGRTA